jgi:hypothetical protein
MALVDDLQGQAFTAWMLGLVIRRWAAMNELDDRLAGDPIWELFPDRAAGPARGSRIARSGRWLAVACLVAASWLLSPPLAVVMACLAIAAGDFRKGRQLARSIPDKAGGTVCARFTYAWGAWKLGLTALAFMFATAITARKEPPEMPPAFLASLLLCLGGYSLSATLTAAGLVRAYRSGMRIWIGEGVNQARTLLLGMLIVGFTVAVLGPIAVWLAARVPNARASGDSPGAILGAVFGLTLGGPLVMLLILDRVCRRVVADRPGKFGPKVPMVGKWNSDALPD